MSIVECVPNFSEGRDRSVIDAIAESIRRVPGARLLDVDPGASTNRTVVTFVGAPDNVLEAAFQAAATAYRLIDMTRHKGEHPRIGAVDVVPFVPVAGVTMADCAALARRFGERVGQELGVPVYLYEEAQPKDYRKTLRDIRAGEYEGLAEKLEQPEWAPDFGPAEFVPRSGARRGTMVFWRRTPRCPYRLLRPPLPQVARSRAGIPATARICPRPLPGPALRPPPAASS